MKRWLLPIALLALIPAAAAAADWRMDPTASELTFVVSYQGSPAPGAFKRFDTQLRFDPARPADGTLRVTVGLASIDMGSTDLNQAASAPEWLDLDKFTEAEFQSTAIKHAAADRYVAHGTLRLKGAQKVIEVPFTWKRDGKAATMTGALSLDRTTFGVGTGQWASGDTIGTEVKVKFHVRLLPAS